MLFFFHDTATTEIYTLSLHDALPICERRNRSALVPGRVRPTGGQDRSPEDRKSTRLNSSHLGISYAVFCLKKKKLHDNVAVCCTRRSFRKHAQSGEKHQTDVSVELGQ